MSVSEPRMFRKVGDEWRPIVAGPGPVPIGEVLDDECILVVTADAQIEIRSLGDSSVVRLLPRDYHNI